ncbi:MaoC family dehydratase [Aliiroseovarius sp. PTFE2010]|uniref:MaoC family dehydratase n=1 Tax=Aliiroseovarius sp. PTFE2010 TaxID=3417190 RepID=UPI003CE942DC
MADTLSNIEVGDAIPSYTTKPITRTTLALFAGASGDHNRIHIDIDFAKKAGMDDVFAQGMLPMAYLGRLLTDWVPQTAIRKFSCRFRSITHLGDAITCSGEVTEKWDDNGETLVKLALQAADGTGDVKLAGEAVVALPTNT